MRALVSIGRLAAIPSTARHVVKHLASLQPAVALPPKGWGTKGFKFWTFLSLLLDCSDCSRLLELGSGRSTITLAEYAKSRNAVLKSLETDRKWFNKARWELRCLGLSDDPIHLVKWQKGPVWYSVDKFRSIARSNGSFDFAFIDGPNDNSGGSLGIRDTDIALREIQNCTSGADIFVIDDVQRQHVFDTADRMLTEPSQYAKLYYDYAVMPTYKNTLCIYVKKSSRAHLGLDKILGVIDMQFYASYDRTRCPEP